MKFSAFLHLEYISVQSNHILGVQKPHVLTIVGSAYLTPWFFPLPSPFEMGTLVNSYLSFLFNIMQMKTMGEKF